LLLTVRFPVTNRLRIAEPWPIKDGSKTFFIDTKDGFATKVGVNFANVPTDVAPKIIPSKGGAVKAEIVEKSAPYRLWAEQDLRAWQALLVTYVLIDIDFDSPELSFKAESLSEESDITVHSFSTNHIEKPRHGGEFAIYGRAFLGREIGLPLIEQMSIYREGARDLFAGRSIDAYNSFYLFLETQFCRGRTGTEQAVNELMARQEFMDALGAAVAEQSESKLKRKLRFDSLGNWQNEPRQLVKEIVNLRGKLRHHSLANPERWNPNNQDDYDAEARFLASVAQNVAFPKTTARLWSQDLLERFVNLAKEMHMAIEIGVRLTIHDGSQTSDVGLNFTLPQPKPDAELARFVLSKAIEKFEEISPGADLYAIRAWVKPSGVEIFRYDVGPTISR
jgi:hypothetical protein